MGGRARRKSGRATSGSGGGSTAARPGVAYELAGELLATLARAGVGGATAVWALFPLVAYVVHKARERGGGPRAVAEVAEELLRGAAVTGAREVAQFAAALAERYGGLRPLREAAEVVGRLGPHALEEALKAIAKRPEVAAKYDVLGAAFELAVGREARSRLGQYFTHENVALAMREIAWARLKAAGADPAKAKVYDPCAGSARLLIRWSEGAGGAAAVYATDVSEEVAALAAANLAIHTNGGRAARADALNHFGPVVNLRAASRLARALLEGRLPAEVPEGARRFAEALLRGLERRSVEVDVSSDWYMDFVEAVRLLWSAGAEGVPGLKELAPLADPPPVVYLMKRVWKEVRGGFDLVLTNPPMGAAVADRYVLAQYSLSQYAWIRGMGAKELERLAEAVGARPDPEDLAGRLGREWASPGDYGGYACRLELRDPELGWSYSVYYDASLEPVLLRGKLPVQALLLEQFLRVVRVGGGVLTVIDDGTLSNPGQEWGRRFLFTRSPAPVKARVNAVVGLPPGAFRYAGAGISASLLFYERVAEIPDDYEFFVAQAEYVGYDGDGRPMKENDLPLIVAEYMSWVGERPDFYEQCLEEWRNERSCNWWERALGVQAAVAPAGAPSRTEAQATAATAGAGAQRAGPGRAGADAPGRRRQATLDAFF